VRASAWGSFGENMKESRVAYVEQHIDVCVAHSAGCCWQVAALCAAPVSGPNRPSAVMRLNEFATRKLSFAIPR
jgi:hypothetical protein